MRQQSETAGPSSSALPASRVEHLLKLPNSSMHPGQHIHTNYSAAGPRPSTAGHKRVIADTADPQLHANESLHSLALQHAGVLRPPAAADASGALRRLCNGAVCASLAPGESLVQQGCEDMVGARSRAPMAGSRPQTVLAELSTRLLMESRERTDPDGVCFPRHRPAVARAYAACIAVGVRFVLQGQGICVGVGLCTQFSMLKHVGATAEAVLFTCEMQRTRQCI